jgi:hypothetical protein
MHFSTSGAIARFHHDTCSVIFESQEHAIQKPGAAVKQIIAGEYIGPGASSPSDKNIYFYSQNGIFEGRPGTDLSVIDKWKKIFTPTLHWSNGQPDAVGFPMNVLQLIFIAPNRFIFLSQLDGIGLYDGQKVVMF